MQLVGEARWINSSVCLLAPSIDGSGRSRTMRRQLKGGDRSLWLHALQQFAAHQRSSSAASAGGGSWSNAGRQRLDGSSRGARETTSLEDPDPASAGSCKSTRCGHRARAVQRRLRMRACDLPGDLKISLKKFH